MIDYSINNGMKLIFITSTIFIFYFIYLTFKIYIVAIKMMDALNSQICALL